MRTTSKYFIIVVSIILLSLALYFVFRSSDNGGEASQREESVPNLNHLGISVEYPTGDEFVIGTEQGSVAVKNFYKTTKEIIEQTEVVLEETNDYLIVYHILGGNFEIYFISKVDNFETVLESAEQSFLYQLGISKTDACRLDVVVNIPYNLPSISGGPQSLSFCKSEASAVQY